MTDNNTLLAISPAHSNIVTETIDHIWKISWLSLHFLFLMWTTLNIEVSLILRVGQKWKGQAGDNSKTTLNIEFELDWSFTVDAMLGDRGKINKILF